jgi:hypothetical protein
MEIENRQMDELLAYLARIANALEGIAKSADPQFKLGPGRRTPVKAPDPPASKK